MNWEKKVEHFLYGVPNGPYVIEESEELHLFCAWLLGIKFIGTFNTLEDAKSACERDADKAETANKA